MSLLLDALKQAEQNKKKNTAPEPVEAAPAQDGRDMPQAQAAEPLAVVEERIEDQDPAPTPAPASEAQPAPGSERATEQPASQATQSITPPPLTTSAPAQETLQDAAPQQSSVTESTPTAAALNPALNVFAAGSNKPAKHKKNPRLIALLLLLVLVILGLVSAYFWLSTQSSKPVYADTPYFDEEIPGDEATTPAPSAPLAEPQPVSEQLPADNPPPEAAKRPALAAAAAVGNEPQPINGHEEAQPDTGDTSLVITRKRPIEIRKRTMTQLQSERLTQAYQALLAGKYDLARGIYQRVLAASPKQLDALLGLAKIHSQENQPQAARQLYEKVLRIDESNSVAQLGLLHTYQGQTAFEKTAVLQELSDKYPENAQIAASLGDELARQSKWSRAQQAYFKAFSLNPGSALYAYNLAVSLDRMEKYGAARQYYLKALDLNANSAGVLSVEAINQRLLQLGD